MVVPPLLFIFKHIFTVKQPVIPVEVKTEAEAKVAAFNKQYKKQHQILFRGRFGYLSRMDKPNKATAAAFQMAARLLGMQHIFQALTGPVETKIGRLVWNGDPNHWIFDPFRYSSETYETTGEMAMFMPGAKELDGTVEGAMRAGLELYP